MSISAQDVQIDAQPILIQGGNSTAVKVDGSAVTQPISGSITVLNASIPVTGTFWQATQPVSGTFWQSTQPVSIATMPTTPVTGTFWQTTQPVSGTLAVSSVGGTVAVTQSTSPWVVSGTVTAGLVTSNSATETQVTSTGSNQTILAANASRKKAVLFFETGTWHVKFGATASATSKTYMITSNNTTIEVEIWVGQIDALCTTSGKLVDVTEMV